MYAYDASSLKSVLSHIIKSQVSAETWAWLDQKSDDVRGPKAKMSLNITFASIPRKIEKSNVRLESDDAVEIQRLLPGLTIENWTLDRLGRVWILLQVSPNNKEDYATMIEGLFLAAEMNELVALYSALPVLAYPEAWVLRCAEGIRSNIGDVLEAIMCNNPYPSKYLDEQAWNQLVLKAIFTEKPLHRIIGLDQRANRELAYTLSDFAHERWAAHRTVPPMLWRCVGPFIDERTFPDIERLTTSVESVEREAAALACRMSDFDPAKELLSKNKELQSIVGAGNVSWESIARKTELV